MRMTTTCEHCGTPITLRLPEPGETLMNQLDPTAPMWLDDDRFMSDNCPLDGDGYALDGTRWPSHEPLEIFPPWKRSKTTDRALGLIVWAALAGIAWWAFLIASR